MKQDEIKVGATYQNRGAGKTTRKVLAIGIEHRPAKYYSVNEPPDESGVLYEQKGVKGNLYIGAFAAWCGKEVEQKK